MDPEAIGIRPDCIGIRASKIALRVTNYLIVAGPENRSHWRERVGTAGIAGGLVAGMIGLLSANPELFVAAVFALGGGVYLKRK